MEFTHDEFEPLCWELLAMEAEFMASIGRHKTASVTPLQHIMKRPRTLKRFFARFFARIASCLNRTVCKGEFCWKVRILDLVQCYCI